MKRAEESRSQGPAARGEGAQAAGRPLATRLPAYYRENLAAAGPLLEAGQELLKAFEMRVAGAAERVGAEQAAGVPGRGIYRDAGSGAGGTLGGLREWFRRRVGRAPHVSSGLRVASVEGRWLEFLRSEDPAVVLAWEKRGFPAEGEALEVPRELVPATAGLQAVLVPRLPRRRGFLPGERVQGVVLSNLSRQAARRTEDLEELT